MKATILSIIALIALLMTGCKAEDPRRFHNVNLNDEEVALVKEVIAEIAEKSGVTAQLVNDPDAESSIEMMDGTVGDRAAATFSTKISGVWYSDIVVTRLNNSTPYPAKVPCAQDHRTYLKLVIMHEIIHAISDHHADYHRHLVDGNVMAVSADGFPKDCKMTAADVAYIDGV